MPGWSSLTSLLFNPEKKWSKKLVGKKLVDGPGDDASTFTLADLPANHRVRRPGGAYNLSSKEGRLNVWLDDDDICYYVQVERGPPPKERPRGW